MCPAEGHSKPDRRRGCHDGGPARQLLAGRPLHEQAGHRGPRDPPTLPSPHPSALGSSSTPSQNWERSRGPLDHPGPRPRPPRLCVPAAGRDDKAPCPWTEACPPPGPGGRAPAKASAWPGTGRAPARGRAERGALTLLEAAVNLLVLQQLLAVVLQRLISRVRHDEKPSLIGDAGKGHGRPGGGGGGARGERPPWEGGFVLSHAPYVGPASTLYLSFLGHRRALKGGLRRHCPLLVRLGKAGCCYSGHSKRPRAILKSLLSWNHKRLCNKLSSE